MEKYSHVIYVTNSLGHFYKIEGDGLYMSSKEDCEYRIDCLYKVGLIDDDIRSNLLNELSMFD